MVHGGHAASQGSGARVWADAHVRCAARVAVPDDRYVAAMRKLAWSRRLVPLRSRAFVVAGGACAVSAGGAAPAARAEKEHAATGGCAHFGLFVRGSCEECYGRACQSSEELCNGVAVASPFDDSKPAVVGGD